MVGGWNLDGASNVCLVKFIVFLILNCSTKKGNQGKHNREINNEESQIHLPKTYFDGICMNFNKYLHKTTNLGHTQVS